MTGYQSKKAAAQDKLDSMKDEALKLALKVLEDLPGFRADIDNAITAIKEALAQPAQEPWPEEPFGHMAGGVQPPQAEVLAQAVPDETLTIVYQSGYYDGKKAALAGRERNFCERCGKRTADLTVIHTCTPPQEING